MKKIILALLICCMFLLNSCTAEEFRHSYSIRDALRISAWVFDETIEGNYYYDDDTIYEFERLKLNEVRLLAPMSALGMENLNIFFEFDGIIEVISADRDIQLSWNNNLSPWVGGSMQGRVFGFEHRFAIQGYLAMNPLGSGRGSRVVTSWSEVYLIEFEVGTAYYLNVNAYRFANENAAVIRAQLRLVQLEDTHRFGGDTNRSPCFSIELISYEFSDRYRIMEEIWDDED